jgi:hypothetical protein
MEVSMAFMVLMVIVAELLILVHQHLGLYRACLPCNEYGRGGLSLRRLARRP